MVNCKFKCTGMNISGEKLISVTFQPLKDGAFGENTPCGNINLVLIPEVASQFVVGKDYLLEFKEPQMA